MRGNYTFQDQYGDQESGTAYQWLVSDSEDFDNYTVAGSARTLTLDDSYFRKYIKFRVMPSNGIHTGDPVDSEAVGPILTEHNTGTPPEATELKIAGGLYTGRTVTAQYQYLDVDLDAEDGTEIVWMTSAQPDEGFMAVQTAEVSPGDKSALLYEITKTDEGKYLRVSVTPRNRAEKGGTGDTKIYTAETQIRLDPAAADRDALDPGSESGTRITGDLYLVLKGENGSVITWESSDPSAIGLDGTVRRGSTDKNVTLTATITLDGYTLTRTFTYIVAAQQSKVAGTSSSSNRGGIGLQGGQLVIDTETEKELSEAQPSVKPAEPVFHDLADAELSLIHISEPTRP